MKEREKLTLVTSEGQLKPALLVEWRRCGWDGCGRTHRVMLLHPHNGVYWCHCGRSDCMWDVAGGPHAAGLQAICPPHLIEERNLWLVDTGLEDEKPAQVERPRQLERTRP